MRGKKQLALTKSLRIPKRKIKSSKRNSQERKRLLQKQPHFLFYEKSKCDLGGSRGRMISASDRSEAVQLINEATASGASFQQTQGHSLQIRRQCVNIGITIQFIQYLPLNKPSKNNSSIFLCQLF